MNTFGIYLLQTSLCLAAFYGLYSVVFRNYTFFQLNRYCLLFCLAISFVIPLIKLPLLTNELQTLSYSIESSLEGWGETGTQSPAVRPATPVNFGLLFTLIYFGGIVALLARILSSVARILKLKKNAVVTQWEAYRIIRSHHTQPFSFFNLIFIPTEGTDPLILRHESVHIRQCHWIDLIVTELAVLALWFNPVVYLYKRSIKIQHEYIADSSAIQTTHTENYLKCLLRQIQNANSCAPISPFYSSTIKKRIMMISKNRTPFRSLAMYALIVPFICTFLFAFSTKQEITHDIEKVTNDEEGGVPSIFPVSMKIATIASGYGNRKHPFTGKRAFHKGIDFRLPAGEIVMTSADGAITVSGYDSLNGNYILIRHNEVYSTKYTHLESAIVKAGESVTQGQTIGYVGSTGWSTAPHLHYEIFKDGENVDPAGYLPK